MDVAAVPPPPTLNTLHPSQRSRLMRSTRKLGAVLGATPHLLESAAVPTLPGLGRSRSCSIKHTPPSPPSDPSRPSSSMDHQPNKLRPAIQLVSMARKGKDESKNHSRSVSVGLLNPKSPALYLIVDTSASSPQVSPTIFALPPAPKPASPPLQRSMSVSASASPLDDGLDDSDETETETDSEEAYSYESTGTSPAASIKAPSPHDSPTAPYPLQDARRRKMAKLIRHLGEGVPCELVFPHAQQPKGKKRPEPLMPSFSTLTTRRKDPPSPTKSRRLHGRRMSEPASPTTPRPTAAAAAATREEVDPDSRRISAPGVHPHRRSHHPTSSAPASSTTPKMATIKEGEDGGRDRDRGRDRVPSWIGQWNVQDMQDVQKALRGLKMR